MKQLHRNYTGAPQFPSDQCWICEGHLAEGDRLLDHSHASRRLFVVFAPDKCNLKPRTVNYISIVGHHVSNYDLHFICKNLYLFPEGNKIQVIPITDEKYNSLSLGTKVASYTDRRGVAKHVYEYLRFVDSYGFMASPLNKLLSCSPAENFSFLENHSPLHCSKDWQLLHQKGFYPYSCFDSNEKFHEKFLPSVEK